MKRPPSVMWQLFEIALQIVVGIATILLVIGLVKHGCSPPPEPENVSRESIRKPRMIKHPGRYVPEYRNEPRKQEAVRSPAASH